MTVEQKDFGRRIWFPRGLPLLILAPLGLGEDDGVDRQDGLLTESEREGERGEEVERVTVGRRMGKKFDGREGFV